MRSWSLCICLSDKIYYWQAKSTPSPRSSAIFLGFPSFLGHNSDLRLLRPIWQRTCFAGSLSPQLWASSEMQQGSQKHYNSVSLEPCSLANEARERICWLKRALTLRDIISTLPAIVQLDNDFSLNRHNHDRLGHLPSLTRIRKKRGNSKAHRPGLLPSSDLTI